MPERRQQIMLSAATEALLLAAIRPSENQTSALRKFTAQRSHRISSPSLLLHLPCRLAFRPLFPLPICHQTRLFLILR